MNIDYTAIIAQLTTFAEGLFIRELPLVQTAAAGYLDTTKARLEQLAKNAAGGQLTKDEIVQALKDEKDIFVSEFKSFEIIGLEITEDVINNAESVFKGIIASVITQVKI